MRACPLKSVCPKKPTLSTEMLNRREWVKRFVVGSAVALTGEAWKGLVLADISPSVNPANVISLKIADYPTLRDRLDGGYGSMRFNLFGITIPNGIITVTRTPTDQFYAVSAYCTHQGTIVDPYLAGDTNAMICYAHNSVYDIQGTVLVPGNGEPSQPNLPSYNNQYDNASGVLRIEIPNLNLKVNSTTLFSVNGATQRFQLSFPVRSNARYRIRYSPDLATPSALVPFATTSAGAVSLTTISPTSNGTRNAWVDSTSAQGFYFVEMIVTEYVP